MVNFTRRQILKGGAGLAAASAFASPFAGGSGQVMAQAGGWKPEAGAELTLLRWKRFVQAEEDGFLALVANFTKATGVKVQVLSESLDDVQPKASVAANTGAGPDLFWGLYSLPHLFPAKCMDVSDVADYLGKKHGGWVPAAETYGKSGGKWIAIPVAFNGNYINYRKAAAAKAGFAKFPADTAGFLELMKALKANNTPGGFALGHASGDGNAWVHWALWAFGGNLVDANDKVIINSPETVKALEYSKQLYEAFAPGTASWNDAFNNKGFLSGEIHLTNNGISIYASARAQSKPKEGASEDEKKNAMKMAEIAEDMDHALWPVGPIGKPTEFHIAYPMLAMGYTKYPNACKAFLQFMMDAENHNKWLEAAVGYLTQSLNAYEANPVWTADPKRTVFREAAKRTLLAGHLGSVGDKAAAALADFIVLDMMANVCTGRETPPAAIKIAERQASRLYR